MRVCGFTIVRNAIKYGYPVVESIRSVLPLCDHFMVAVGDSDDGTLDLIRSIDPLKISIIQTVWDPSLRKGGRVLAVETNKAFDAIGSEYDWCFYIQADEVIHEKDYPAIRQAMLDWKETPEVEGLLLKYYHFWGTFHYIGVSRKWYRHEIRIVRNDKRIRSYRDAQGFRKDDEKLRVKPVDAHIYHYGWVRPPAVVVDKMRAMHSLYHSDAAVDRAMEQVGSFTYNEIDAVQRFEGTHPLCMQQLINEISWDVSLDESKISMRLKDRLLYFLERITGYRLFEYKNYIRI